MRGDNCATKKIIDSELNDLTNIVERVDVSPLEAKRCADDLKNVKIRLASREYVHSAFKPRNAMAILDRTQEICSDLGFLSSVGAVWQNIFDRVGLRPEATILDIGCGYFPKVELGLYYHGFEGTVVMCDPHRAALEQAAKFLKFFRVPFEAQTLASSLWDVSQRRFDAIVANHVLDDLMLAEYTSVNNIEIDVLYREESLYVEAWKRISSERFDFSSLIERLKNACLNLLNTNGLILFLDYPGFSHRALGMKNLHSVVGNFRRALIKALQHANLRELSLLGNGTVRRDKVVIKNSYLVAFKRDYVETV